jgi:hypothetical protein
MRAIITAIATSVIVATSLSAAHARPITDGEKKWAADLRACAEAAGVPKDAVEFRLVGDALKAFFKNRYASQRDGCLAKVSPAPSGEKTDL